MKTKPCSECREPMAATARKCPHCGATQNLSSRTGWVIALGVVLFVAMLWPYL
jgi:RNA polymerase subunit RPABC4/transcription elongation factor Spt4